MDPNSCNFWIGNVTFSGDDVVNTTLAGIQLCLAKQNGDETYLIGGTILNKN
jgi:hypothetical protein